MKDLEHLEGTRTTFGASIYKDFVADHSGTVAQRFLAAGVTIFGKTSSPEFGLMPTTESRLFGPTRNPWNLAHSSGGSSGGAAAAVAARILPLAHASDGGGSIRIPASASGVFGMKPTRARNPPGPDRGEGWGGFSCGHVVSISVRDSAAMLDAIHGPEPSSPYVAPPPERPFLAGGRPRSRPLAHRLHRQVALWRRHRSGIRRGDPRGRSPARGPRPPCRGAGAGAGRRSGGRDVDHRRPPTPR